MIYSVPIFYEVKEEIEVDLPEGTCSDDIRKEALKKFYTDGANESKAEYVDSSESILEEVPILMVTEDCVKELQKEN